MTTLGKQIKDRTLRFLDLSFEGRQRQFGNRISVNRSKEFRPHHGSLPRGQKKRESEASTTKQQQQQQQQTASILDYQHQLTEDLDRLFATEHSAANAGSTNRGCEAPNTAESAEQCGGQSAETSNSPGQGNKVLASSRIDAQGNVRLTKAGRQASHPRSAPPGGREASTAQATNRTHQYITDTPLKELPAEFDPKLGRPTRTTLLRARQRCSSAPVSRYESRKEIQQKSQDRQETKRNMLNNLSSSLKDLMGAVPEGESIHSYLTGARYNRAHHVDAKSLSEFGVYMPRGSPKSCFVIKSINVKHMRAAEASEAPPSSPDECMRSTSEHSSPSSMKSSSPEISPRVSTRGSEEKTPVYSSPPTPASFASDDYNDFNNMDYSVDGDESHGDGRHQIVINQNDGLNIRGVGFNRPRSQHNLVTARPIIYQMRPNASKGLKSVHIQGRQIQTQPTANSLDEMANHKVVQKNRRGPSVRDISEKLKLENIMISKKPLLRQNEKREHVKPVPNNTVNVPSVTDITTDLDVDMDYQVEEQPTHIKEIVLQPKRPKSASVKKRTPPPLHIKNDSNIMQPIVLAQEQVHIDHVRKQHTQINGIIMNEMPTDQSCNDTENTSIIKANRVCSARGKKTRVHFAEQLIQPPSTPKQSSDNADKFFLTEDEQNGNCPNNLAMKYGQGEIVGDFHNSPSSILQNRFDDIDHSGNGFNSDSQFGEPHLHNAHNVGINSQSSNLVNGDSPTECVNDNMKTMDDSETDISGDHSMIIGVDIKAKAPPQQSEDTDKNYSPG